MNARNGAWVLTLLAGVCCSPLRAEGESGRRSFELQLLLCDVQDRLDEVVQECSAIDGKLKADMQEPQRSDLSARKSRLEQLAKGLQRRQDLIKHELARLDRGGPKQLRDIIELDQWATITNIRRGNESTGEYSVRLLTTDEKKKLQEQRAAYLQQSAQYEAQRKEIQTRLDEVDQSRREELLRDLAALGRQFRDSWKSPPSDAVGGFHRVIEVGADYVAFCREESLTVTYHRLSSIRTIVRGLD